VRISAALPTGVAALLFESARRRREAEERLAAELRGAGYAEVILPILDYLEPYESLLTPASRGELYRFVDRDGELLALRADFTPLLARLLAPRLQSLALPLRLFYRGDVIRYQEERAGRAREFYQLGAELLGLPGEAAEREVLRLFLELSTAAGGASLQIVLGFAGALDRLLLTAETGDPIRLANAVARRERGEVRRSCPKLLSVVEDGMPERPEDLGPEAAGRLRDLLALRDELAAEFPDVQLTIDLAEFARSVLDPRLTTGEGERSYYDGLVFHAYAGPAAVPVGGGGRYDRLFRALGAEVPAVGFSLSLERLLEAGTGMPAETSPPGPLSSGAGEGETRRGES
jgi:ATP phosphoribosyltransferase regulatory subunit